MENNQKGITPIIIALIVAVILGGGYLIVRQQAKNSPKVENTTVSSTTATNDWKTYKSDIYDYEIKVPAQYQILKDFVRAGVSDIETARYTDKDYSFKFQVFARNGFVLDRCLKDSAGKDLTETKEVNGNIFYTYKEKREALGLKEPIPGSIESEYHTIHNNQCYIVEYVMFYDNSSAQNNADSKFEILNQIFSTFKFTSLTQSKGSVSETRRIEIISPKGGETYKLNQKITISWNDRFGRDADNFTVALVDQKSSQIISSSFVRSSGLDGVSSVEWVITGNLNGKYRIEIYPTNSRELVARSNEFTIARVSPDGAVYDFKGDTPGVLITVLYPNGGEVLKKGQTYKISFASTGDLGSKTIWLNRYSDDNIRLGTEVIGTSDNASEFIYTVPSGIEVTRFSPNYKIQVLVDKYNSGKGVADESDKYFTITN